MAPERSFSVFRIFMNNVINMCDTEFSPPLVLSGEMKPDDDDAIAMANCAREVMYDRAL